MRKILSWLILAIVVLVAIAISPGLLKPTLTNESRVTVNRPREESWKKFINPDNMEKWLIGFKSVERISGEDGTPGSKYKIVIEEDGQRYEAIETIKEVVEDKKFAFELSGDYMTDDIVMTFVSKGLTTEVIQSETIKVKGMLMNIMFYWLQGTMSKRSQDNLNNLKKFVEEG